MPRPTILDDTREAVRQYLHDHPDKRQIRSVELLQEIEPACKFPENTPQRRKVFEVAAALWECGWRRKITRVKGVLASYWSDTWTPRQSWPRAKSGWFLPHEEKSAEKEPNPGPDPGPNPGPDPAPEDDFPLLEL